MFYCRSGGRAKWEKCGRFLVKIMMMTSFVVRATAPRCEQQFVSCQAHFSLFVRTILARRNFCHFSDVIRVQFTFGAIKRSYVRSAVLEHNSPCVVSLRTYCECNLYMYQVLISRIRLHVLKHTCMPFESVQSCSSAHIWTTDCMLQQITRAIYLVSLKTAFRPQMLCECA